MGNGPASARLPGEAPQQLKDFVACRASSVVLDTDSLGWVPSGGLGDAAPTITMTPGASAGTATIRVGWDFIGLDLPASIGANGELVVDTSNIPGMASGAKDGIDSWVRAFNATMAANGKRLDGFTVSGTNVTITKRAVAATAPTEQVAAVPPTPVASATTSTTPEPAPTPNGGTPAQKGCLAWALGLLAVIGVGAGVYFAARDDGADEVATTIVAATDAAPATDFAPATDVAPATPPATDAPDSTDTPADTAAPATDVAATDGPPPTTEPPPPPTQRPADFLGLSAPYGGVFDDLELAALKADLDQRLDLFAPDASGDVIDCNASTPLGTTGPDVTGLIGTIDIDEETARLIVLMAQPPTDTAQGFSFAVLLQTITVSNQQQFFQWETHDGVQSIGQLDGAGNVIPGTESTVTLGTDGILFTVPADPSDPFAGVGARAFNTPLEGDPLACDDLFAVPFDSSLPLSTTTAGTCFADTAVACVHNGRFAVTLVGQNGPATPTESDFDDATGFESGDLDAWARVVNGCSLSNTFWVFAAATTDVEYTMSVTDTASGVTKVFDPLGPASPAITDTSAFATCP